MQITHVYFSVYNKNVGITVLTGKTASYTFINAIKIANFLVTKATQHISVFI